MRKGCFNMYLTLEEAELEDVLESVPPEHRKVIERMMISSSIHMRSISSYTFFVTGKEE